MKKQTWTKPLIKHALSIEKTLGGTTDTMTDEVQEPVTRVTRSTAADIEEDVPNVEDLPRSVQKLIDSLHPYQLLGVGTGFMGAVNSGYTEPQTYTEAINSPDAPHWLKSRG